MNVDYMLTDHASECIKRRMGAYQDTNDTFRPKADFNAANGQTESDSVLLFCSPGTAAAAMLSAQAAMFSLVLIAAFSAAHSLPCSAVDTSWMGQYNVSASSSGPYCVQLTNDITLQYALVGNDVLFHVEAVVSAATAYLGIGLSELGSMKGSDMAIFHNSQLSRPAAATADADPSDANTTSTNSIAGWRLVDSYAQGFMAPTPDTQQDLKLRSLSFSPTNNTLSATWLRPLVPCDETQDLPLAVGMPFYILWAYSDRWGYHGANRGSKLIKFAAGGNTSSTGEDHASDTGSSSIANVTGASAETKKPEVALLLSSDGAPPGGVSGPLANETAASSTASSSGSGLNGSDIRVLEIVFPADIPPEETTYWVHYFHLPDDRWVGGAPMALAMTQSPQGTSLCGLRALVLLGQCNIAVEQ